MPSSSAPAGKGVAQLKATGFNSATAAMRELAGPEPFARVVAKLSPATQALVNRPPMAITWVDATHYGELLQAVAREIFASDERRLMDAGRLSVSNDMRGVYKLFIRVLSPQYVIGRGAQLWDTYVRNNGSVHTVAAERSAEVHYSGIAQELSFPAYWAWQRGALQAIGEATGLKQVRVETVSGGGHVGHCVMRVSW